MHKTYSQFIQIDIQSICESFAYFIEEKRRFERRQTFKEM